MVVDRASDFVLDEIERFSLRAHLLAGDRHTAASLRRSFDQAVKVALTSRTDDHNVIRAMVRGHAHAADIVLKAAARDLRRDDRHRLWVYVVKVMRGRQRHASNERLAAVAVGKRPHVQVRRGFAPDPAMAARMVVFQVFQNFADVDVLIRRQSVFAHLTPPNRAEASSIRSGCCRRRPAARSSSPFCFA